MPEIDQLREAVQEVWKAEDRARQVREALSGCGQQVRFALAYAVPAESPGGEFGVEITPHVDGWEPGDGSGITLSRDDLWALFVWSRRIGLLDEPVLDTRSRESFVASSEQHAAQGKEAT